MEAETDGYRVDELLQRLTLYGYGLFGCFPHPAAEPVLRVSGQGPEDLAMNVLVRYLDPNDEGVSWRPEKGRLLSYLKRVLWHDFLDLKRAALYRHTEAEPVSLDEVAARQDSAEARVVRQQERERLLARLAGEPELCALLALQMAPEGYPGYTNQELAARLNTTVAEIENRKKRLLNRLLRIWREQPAAAPGGVYAGTH